MLCFASSRNVLPLRRDGSRRVSRATLALMEHREKLGERIKYKFIFFS